MNTLIIAASRSEGVAWLKDNVAKTDDERRRTQTEIFYKNGDYISVISRAVHLRGRVVGANDRAILVGNVPAELIEAANQLYQARGLPLEINRQGGEIMTATEIKRRHLQQQMADLEREERLDSFFKNVKIEEIGRASCRERV